MKVYTKLAQVFNRHKVDIRIVFNFSNKKSNDILVLFLNVYIILIDEFILLEVVHA
jgi:hypothetical protein